MTNLLPKIVTIVGPTASGKTSLSITLAKRFGGEVVSADSRQVYRGLDLGSGKVTVAEMAGVPHHLLDIADPKDTYTAHDFERDGQVAIAKILSRGRLPIIAGGSFLYVDALLGNISTPPVPPNEALRQELASLPLSTLMDQLQSLDPSRAATVDAQNPRRVIRAIEVATTLGHVPPTTTEERYQSLSLGILIDQETLYRNIHIRLHERLEAGMVDEVRTLREQGVSHERLEALGLEYRYVSRYLEGLLTYEEMVPILETKIRQFAKRQRTWLKRDQRITWVDPKDHARIFELVESFISH